MTMHGAAPLTEPSGGGSASLRGGNNKNNVNDATTEPLLAIPPPWLFLCWRTLLMMVPPTAVNLPAGALDAAPLLLFSPTGWVRTGGRAWSDAGDGRVRRCPLMPAARGCRKILGLPRNTFLYCAPCHYIAGDQRRSGKRDVSNPSFARGGILTPCLVDMQHIPWRINKCPCSSQKFSAKSRTRL